MTLLNADELRSIFKAHLMMMNKVECALGNVGHCTQHQASRGISLED